MQKVVVLHASKLATSILADSQPVQLEQCNGAYFF